MVGLPKDVTATPMPASTKNAATTNGGKTGQIKIPVAESNVRKQTKQPDTLSMVLDAVRELTERKGVTVMAIRSYVIRSHPDVNKNRLKYLLKNALAKGLANGTLARPSGEDPNLSPALGRYKLGKVVKVTKPKVKKATVDRGEEKPKKKTNIKAPLAVPTKKVKAKVVKDSSEKEKKGSTSTKRTKAQPKGTAQLEGSTSAGASVTREKQMPRKTAKRKSSVQRMRLSGSQIRTKAMSKAVWLSAAATPGKTKRTKATKASAAATEGPTDTSQDSAAPNVTKPKKPAVVKSTHVKVESGDGDMKAKPKATSKKTTAAEVTSKKTTAAEATSKKTTAAEATSKKMTAAEATSKKTTAAEATSKKTTAAEKGK